MFKRLVPLFISLCLLLGVAYAGENYTLSGDVTFQHDGDIYICVFTKEEFRDFVVPNYDLSQLRCKVIKLNSDLKREGEVSFRLDGIPKGTYCIITYQDVNKNGKVDFINLLIDEPFGSYRELSPARNILEWKLVRFDLEKDITGIEIHM